MGGGDACLAGWLVAFTVDGTVVWGMVVVVWRGGAEMRMIVAVGGVFVCLT